MALANDKPIVSITSNVTTSADSTTADTKYAVESTKSNKVVLTGSTIKVRIEVNGWANLPDLLFNAISQGLFAKDLIPLASTCVRFNSLISRDRKLQMGKIYSFATNVSLTRKEPLTITQLTHLRTPRLKQEIMDGRITVGQAISNTAAERLKGFSNSYGSWKSNEPYQIRAIKLGYQPRQIRENWFLEEHCEVLEELDKLQNTLMLEKQNLDALVNQNKELKLIAEDNKKKRELDLAQFEESQKKNIEDTDRCITHMKRADEAANLSENSRDIRIGHLEKEIHDSVEAVQNMMKKNKEEDTKADKEQGDRETKEKEAKEKYEKLEKEYKAFEDIFAYDKIRGLSLAQLIGLRLGLLPSQLKDVKNDHLDLFREWKLSQLNPRRVQELFEANKQFNPIQRDGIKAGFSREEVLSPWFSRHSLAGHQAGFSHKDLAQPWFSETHIKLVSQGYTAAELRGLPDDKVNLLQYGYDRKTLLGIKTKIEYYHINAIKSGCALTEVVNLDSSQCRTLEQARDMGLETKKLFDRKGRVESHHLLAIKAGYDLDEIINLDAYQCEALVTYKLTPKDVRGNNYPKKYHLEWVKKGYNLEEIRDLSNNDLAIIEQYKINLEAWKEFRKKPGLPENQDFNFDQLFAKCPFEEAKKLSVGQLKAIVAGCALAEIINLDSHQCGILAQARELGLDTKDLFDRKMRVESHHLTAVKAGYKLDDIISLDAQQCAAMVEYELTPKDVIGKNLPQSHHRKWLKKGYKLEEIRNLGIDELYMIERFTISVVEWQAFRKKLNKSHSSYFNFNILFEKCTFAQASKLSTGQLNDLADKNYSYEDVLSPEYAKFSNNSLMQNCMQFHLQHKFKDLIGLSTDALYILQGNRCSLEEVLTMDQEMLSVFRETNISIEEYQRLKKTAIEHSLNSKQLIALSSEYNLSLEQVKDPGFSIELAKALRNGAKFEEARQLNHVQLRLFNHSNQPWNKDKKRLTIEQVKKAWITPLAVMAIDSSLLSYKEVEGLNGPQLLGRLLGYSKEEVQNDPQFNTPKPMLFSAATASLVESTLAKASRDSAQLSQGSSQPANTAGTAASNSKAATASSVNPM